MRALLTPGSAVRLRRDYGISGAVLVTLSDDDFRNLLGLSEPQLSRMRYALRDVREDGGGTAYFAPPTGSLPSATVPSFRRPEEGQSEVRLSFSHDS